MIRCRVDDNHDINLVIFRSNIKKFLCTILDSYNRTREA